MWQIDHYETRLGKKPSSFTTDQLYETRKNRELLDKEGIRYAFKPLGRKRKNKPSTDRWLNQKQKERNCIEGHFVMVKPTMVWIVSAIKG